MPDLAVYVCALNLRCDGTPVRGVQREATRTMLATTWGPGHREGLGRWR